MRNEALTTLAPPPMTREPPQQDLFAPEIGRPASRRQADARPELDIKAAVRLLDAHDDYRVLRRVRPRTPIGRRPLLPGEQLLVVLDTETTGLDRNRHEIVELGMLSVIHDSEGAIVGVAEEFSGLREPASPLPVEITNITGITPAMLAGQTIDVAIVETFIGDAHRVCAHNSGFDRGFAERFVPGFAHMRWARSLREIDRVAIGTVDTKLDHRLGRFGMFHGRIARSTTATRCCTSWRSGTGRRHGPMPPEHRGRPRYGPHLGNQLTF